MSLAAKLEAEAREFAERLNRTLEQALDARVRVAVTVLEERVVVRTPDVVVLSTSDGVPLLDLDVNYECDWDAAKQFLGVRTSAFKVHAHGDRSPLFRYDFDKASADSVPTAHLQVHAHRDAFTWVMTRAGRTTSRSRARAQETQKPPRMEEVHFPLGGRRFRPALEDLLEMLIQEFGIHAEAETWRQALAEGREHWRRIQLRSAIRDAHGEAVEALRGLGYAVKPPESGVGERSAALRQY